LEEKVATSQKSAKEKTQDKEVGLTGARGKPGTPQPPHDELSDNKSQLNKLAELTKTSDQEFYPPSAERKGKNINPEKPEDREPTFAGMATTGPRDLAAGAVRSAIGMVKAAETIEARLNSDPRRERDQKVFELGRQGKLGLVPPSEAEVAATAERMGYSTEVTDKLPKTPEEQVEEDTKRLEAAENATPGTTPQEVKTEAQKSGSKTSTKTSTKSTSTKSGAKSR
jgi:hypothetical protein